MSSSALCGPSNPLASLEKHTQHDRTLQQDRFHAQDPSSGGFRKQAPDDFQVELEFAQFANGGELAQPERIGLPLEFQQQQQIQRSQFLPPPPQQLQYLRSGGWADDFRKLQIQPQPQQELGFDSSTGRWHEELTRTAIETTGSTQLWPGLEPTTGVSSFPYDITSGQYAQPLQQQTRFAVQQAEPKAAEVFDEEAMEKAFAEAEREVELGVPRQPQNTQLREMPPEETWEEVKKEDGKDKSGQDDLARTAAQLLESLKENKSRKFQESKFLGLMRQLRDREVTVEGDQMVQLERGDGR